ncbi:MAG TPA: hypothetical protein VJS30_15725 [Paraburkholderia sp.]|nr:hypothetical protein [Paraburkholderia sp.]
MNSIRATEYHEHASLAGRKRAQREETNRAESGETTRASLAGGKRAEREENDRARAKTQTQTETGQRPLSPYTIQNLDAAIAHLEIAMNADKAMAIFGQSYWHGRVLELRSTPGILHAQERRLLCLMDRFAATG